MATQKPVTTIILDDELKEKIDEYWHENRLPNRATAIRELLEVGLKQYEKEKLKKK